MIDEVYAADLLFEDVEFIKEEDEGGVGETMVVLDSSEHLDRLHQFVFRFLAVPRQDVGVELVNRRQEDDAGHLPPHHVDPVGPLASVSADVCDLELNVTDEELVRFWNALGPLPDSDYVLFDGKVSSLIDPLDLVQETEMVTLSVSLLLSLPLKDCVVQGSAKCPTIFKPNKPNNQIRMKTRVQCESVTVA